MILFIILAAALTFATAIAIAFPLLKRDSTTIPQAPWTALSVIAVLVVGGAASYVALSNWTWPTAQQEGTGPGSPQEMVAHLQARLEKNPQDLDGWMMLGHSYMVLDQVPLAVRAYEHATLLSGDKNPEALVGLAEALAVQDESQLEGRAGELIEKALQIDPNSAKALFYGGAAAVRRGDLPLARQRFASMLTLNPPENVRPIIEEQIAAIDQQLGTAPAGANAGGSPPAASGANAPAAGASVPSVASSVDSAAIHVTVSLSPKLSGSLPAGAPLFVFVRDPNQGGPPLAVKRLANRFPQTVELTSADAMVPGREFAIGQQVQVVARIARSGTPTAQSGDPFGEVAYRVGHDKTADIVIDRLTP